jgi:hypothetical protein
MEYITTKDVSKDHARFYFFASTVTFLVLVFYASYHTWEFDEAWSYVSVKNESFLDLIKYKNFNIANNHVLNSIWFKLMQGMGMTHVFFYRFISVLSFLLFAFYLFKIVVEGNADWSKKNNWQLIFFFLPPAFIFFGAGRGYSLAIATFCASLYYLKRYIQETDRPAHYWKFLAFGILSSLAIVSFFYPFVAMLIYLVLRVGRWNKIDLQNIITVIIMLGVAAYIYHVGKTIILYDTIINGSDNLFVAGMYSTFFSSLAITDIAFPAKALYAKLKLGMISGLAVLITLVPVVLVLARKGLARYKELSILVIMTLMFFLSHIFLKAKYPSDRSAIYLLYLIYIPVLLYLVSTRNIFFRIHYYVIFLFAAINFIGLMYEMTTPNLYKFLQEKNGKPQMILSDWPNFADEVNNELNFNNSLHFNYLVKSYEKDRALIDRKTIEAASDKEADIILLQQDNYLRNKQYFSNDTFTVRLISTSNLKELYLLERKK